MICESDGSGDSNMALIDVDALRSDIEDYYGSAMFSGFPAAILDLSDVDSMSGEELCEKAEELGMDLNKYVVGEE